MAKPAKKGAAAPRGAGRRAATGTAQLLRRVGWRRGTLLFFLLSAFGIGFYLADLYANISVLIEQRRAALTSAIYSAPLTITPGDAIGPLHLLDRLNALSYARTNNPAHPGEYSMRPGAMTIAVREFAIGSRGFPATIVRLRFENDRVADLTDSFGAPLTQAKIEPEVIGRLL